MGSGFGWAVVGEVFTELCDLEPPIHRYSQIDYCTNQINSSWGKKLVHRPYNRDCPPVYLQKLLLKHLGEHEQAEKGKMQDRRPKSCHHPTCSGWLAGCFGFGIITGGYHAERPAWQTVRDGGTRRDWRTTCSAGSLQQSAPGASFFSF